jgi:hypothetical protein
LCARNRRAAWSDTSPVILSDKEIAAMEKSLLKLSSIKNDRSRIEAGDWVVYPAWSGPTGQATVRFRVSGTSSTAFRRALEDLGKKWGLKYKGDRVPEEISYRETGELLAEHVLHEWDGFDEPYSPERALELLTDRDFDALTKAVEWCSQRLEQLNLEFIGDAEKN